MATLALTAALTFTPIATIGERWIPTEYVDAIRKEAHHRNPSGSDVVAPPLTDWAKLVAAYFKPKDVAAALRVIDCESQFVLTADNPRSTALGPWQFLRSTWNWVAANTGSPSYDSGAPTDPVWSTINAAWLWYNVGPRQWSCW